MLCSTIAPAKASPQSTCRENADEQAGKKKRERSQHRTSTLFVQIRPMTSRPIRQAARTWPPRNPGMIRPIWLSSLKNIAVRKSSDLRFHNRTGGHGRPKARKGSHMDVILPKFRTHPAQDTDLPRARRTALPRNATRPAGRPGAHTPTQSLYATCVFGFSCSLDFPKNTSYQHRKQ